jgi:hypothetical protein
LSRNSITSGSLPLDSNNPVLGTNWDLTTTGLSPISPIAITFFGTARVDPGLPLPVIGINSQGCSVHFSGFITSGAATCAEAPCCRSVRRGRAARARCLAQRPGRS